MKLIRMLCCVSTRGTAVYVGDDQANAHRKQGSATPYLVERLEQEHDTKPAASTDETSEQGFTNLAEFEEDRSNDPPKRKRRGRKKNTNTDDGVETPAQPQDEFQKLLQSYQTENKVMKSIQFSTNCEDEVMDPPSARPNDKHVEEPTYPVIATTTIKNPLHDNGDDDDF